MAFTLHDIRTNEPTCDNRVACAASGLVVVPTLQTPNGPEAFYEIPHADGVGSWNASFLTYEVDANGVLTVFDWSVGFRTWWDVDELMHMLRAGESRGGWGPSEDYKNPTRQHLAF